MILAKLKKNPYVKDLKSKNAFHIYFGNLEDLAREAKNALKGKVRKENSGGFAMFSDLNDFILALDTRRHPREHL